MNRCGHLYYPVQFRVSVDRFIVLLHLMITLYRFEFLWVLILRFCGCLSSTSDSLCIFILKTGAMSVKLNDQGSSCNLALPSEADPEIVHNGDGSVDMQGASSLKSSPGTWRACLFILGMECCEQLTFFGIAQNLVTYLTLKLHFGNAAAAKNVTNWTGTCNLTPLLGALLADAYWGRYRTIAVFSAIYFIGMTSLILSASISAFQHTYVNYDGISPAASALEYGLYFSALYLIAVGSGAIRSCISAFGADQFDDSDSAERRKKATFFNWFYFSMNMGSLFANSIIVWVQDNVGWVWGYGIPTLFLAGAIIIFFAGTPLYRFQKPGGSPLTRVCQVFVASLCNWNNEIPKDDSMLYEVQDKNSAIQGSRKIDHTNDYRCLDKAAIIPEEQKENAPILGYHHNPWRLCTVTQVEELKILIHLFPIWVTGVVYCSVLAQMFSVFVEQGMVMDSNTWSFKIPPASLSLFFQLGVLVWVPIYDQIIVPVANKFTGQERGFTQLQRMGIGLVFTILAMVLASIVETVRLNIARHANLIHHKTPVPMSILWQIPPYFLIGTASVFYSVGQLEFFYDQSPDAMRSLCTALAYVSGALGNYLSTMIVTIVTAISSRHGKPGWIPNNLNEGHLDYYFWLLAVLSFLNFLSFMVFASSYKYKLGS